MVVVVFLGCHGEEERGGAGGDHFSAPTIPPNPAPSPTPASAPAPLLIPDDTCPQNVVVMDGVSERERNEAMRAGLRVYAFAEVEGIGASHAHPHRPPSATGVATFC